MKRVRETSQKYSKEKIISEEVTTEPRPNRTEILSPGYTLNVFQ